MKQEVKGDNLIDNQISDILVVNEISQGSSSPERELSYVKESSSPSKEIAVSRVTVAQEDVGQVS